MEPESIKPPGDLTSDGEKSDSSFNKLPDQTAKKRPDVAQEMPAVRQEDLNRAAIAVKFEKEFGIKREELASVEGFDQLSPGQQVLVLENLRQVVLGRIQEEGLVKTRKEAAEAGSLPRIWRSWFKQYYIAKAEKATAEEIMKGGIETHRKALEFLVQGMKENGPVVEIDENNNLEIRYAKIEGATPEQKKVIDNFNKLAAEFSKTPLRWSELTASKKEQNKFKKLELAYNEARKELIEVIAERYGEAYTLNTVLKIDRNIRFNQFLTANPEVENELKNIASVNLWRRAIKSVITERGAYMGFGYISRAVTASLLGAIAVPLTAAGIGGWIARKRTTQTLQESVKLKEELGSGKEKILTFVDSENLSKKISDIIEKINNSTTAEEAERQLLRLEARLNYTWRQLNKGMVNFGRGAEKIANQYELLQKMAEAEIRVSGLKNREVERKLNERLDNFLRIRQRKMEAEYKKYLYSQMLKGAMMGAAFATLGYAIRDFFWGGRGLLEADVRTAGAPLVEPSPSGPTRPPLETIEAQQDVTRVAVTLPDTAEVETPTDTTRVVGQPAETVELPEAKELTIFEQALKDQPETYIETIKKGGSVWSAIENQLKQHFGENFKNLGEAQRTYIIDAIKDRIVAAPEKYGLVGVTDIDNLPPGAKIDFSSIFQDKAEMESIFGKAGVLSEAQVENIERNNEILREWVRSHPNEQLTSEKVEEIIRGGAPETAAAEVETPMPQEAAKPAEAAEQVRSEGTKAAPTETVQEIIPGSRKGEFIIPESGHLYNARIRFFYDEKTGLPIHHQAWGQLFEFNPEDKLKDDWFEIMSRKLKITVSRGYTPHDDYLFSKVKNLEIIERIAEKLPKNTPEARYLEIVIGETRREITERFGDVLTEKTE